MFDHRLFAVEVAGVVREFTAQAVAPLMSRLEALEQRIAALPAPAPDHGVAILRLREDIEKLEGALEALPKAQDGQSPTHEELAPLIAAEISRAVSGLRGGIAGMVIDRQGELIVTMANGDQKSLGCIVGRDGLPGAAGKDGLGFDDMTAEYDGDRTLTLKFMRGEETKAFAFDLPLTLYRGTYKAADNYRAGDAVTYGGSQWIARRDTTDKPETSDAWQLACKRGRDGKDGKDGAPGPQGPEGRAGRDLTQMGANGQKW